jgi:hypothetical protein
MKKFSVQQSPDDRFWEEYAELWQCSEERSPFQSPEILKYFAGLGKEDVFAFQLHSEDKLAGAVLLKRDKKVYHFLSDRKTDANFFVFRRKATDEDIRLFFTSLLDTLKGSGFSLMLNNVPGWASYMPILVECGEKAGLFWQNLKYSVSPVIEGSTPEELGAIVKGSKEIRYKSNRLKNHHNAHFEVLTSGEDMEKWVDEFCQSHILRWKDTPTPSGYRKEQKQQFLLGCLQAWQRDGVLVRFAVKVKDRRVGFVIGLISGESLIHHSVTYHPEFQKMSPGKAVLLAMSEWMKENNARILDFGDGDEDYKYQFANKEHVLSRIFVAEKTSLAFILRTKSIKLVRSNAYLFKLYRDRIKILQKKLAS